MAICDRLELTNRQRDLELFELIVDSKPRVCDLVALQVRDMSHGGVIISRVIVIQRKTKQSVQFEITEKTRIALRQWIKGETRAMDDFFMSRKSKSCHLSTRQYARIVKRWVTSIGFESSSYGTHTLR